MVNSSSRKKIGAVDQFGKERESNCEKVKVLVLVLHKNDFMLKKFHGLEVFY